MSRHVPQCEIDEALQAPGSYEIYLLGETPRHCLVGFWIAAIGARVMLCSDPALGEACIDFLIGQGVRRFTSDEELIETARSENWPGWEHHLRHK